MRCGRRLDMQGPQPGALGTATAPALESLPGGQPVVSTPPEAISQPSLFRDASGSPKVIPIPTLTPLRRAAPDEVPVRRSAAKPSRPVSRRPADSQRSLDLYESEAALAGPAIEAVIYCDAPVAPPAHRMLALAVDASIVLIGAGLFLVVFLLSGGVMALSRQSVSFVAGIAVVIAMFYRALWCLANGDTPGMRCTGLKLVDFDGRRPDREQRGLRQMASLLSVLSAGLGLVWALVDEEKLTWHDHISKTFPTTG